MKKTLLSLAILLLGLGAAKAGNIVEDWSTAKDWAVTSWTKEDTTPQTKTSTATNISYDFMGTYVSSYLFIQGKNTTGAYISYSLPIDCSEIVLTTTSGCSTNNKSAVNVYADGNKISTVVLNKTSTDFKISIPAQYQTKGTVYKIESNTNSYNQQIEKSTYVEATTDPTMSIAQAEIGFATPLNATQGQTVSGTVSNTTENISVSVDNSNFSLASTSITAAELSEGIVVTYTGKAAGKETATLKFEVAGLTQTVALSAITVANEGTEANPLTVADVLALQNLNPGPFYVTGIIGDKTAGNATDGMVTEVPPIKSNIILKDSEGKMIGVQVSGETRTILNILDNPSNAGQTVIVKGNLENYFGAPGVKNTEYVSGLPTNGIADIVADENAPVEYFNLQGIRVENPENGLYIRRQGNKVTKVIVK
ncbi:DUF6359 domain-containing protein [Duncaniella muris]|uniref:DUF6359 domain-containing protein n=1 Tax=Duncaniella muris TaxID=2094150 RepID=UPI001C3DDE90|nr:DUF6359 domain-containing protein [Duncaniella muris]